MRSSLTAILFTCSLLLSSPGYSQTNSSDLTVRSKAWNAYWIMNPNDPGREYGVYYFRKSIDLPAKPPTFLVKVSADNRYKLYVNGTLISLGPVRGDTYYW